MARIFKDGAGLGYDVNNAKYLSPLFGQVLSAGTDFNTLSVVANGTGINSKTYELHDFTSADLMEKKADNTVVGIMMDCGECHVGGGAMEYIPKYLRDGFDEKGSAIGLFTDTTSPSGSASVGTPSPSNRVSLRDWSSTLATAFNYFIDVFGTRGKSEDATYLAKKIDYSEAGVLEMDCLVCHLKDYNWEKRRDAVRMAKFDASRAVGAGIATFGSYTTTDLKGTASGATIVTNGRTVAYLPISSAAGGKVVFINGSTASNGMKLAPAVGAAILAKPDAKNCSSCHFATVQQVPDASWPGKFQVEWKKRGEFWGGSEVHTGIGCMGCHQRKDRTVNGDIETANVGTSGLGGNTSLGLCDPAKGGDCSYDAQWNKVDKVAFKNCNDCHKDPDATNSDTLGNGEDYDAINPKYVHAAFGLASTSTIINGKFVNNKIAYRADGSRASHLDIIDCTVCHVRKLDAQVPLYTRDIYGGLVFREYTTIKITGGALVDGTGKDEQGRLATHDEVAVEREMKDVMVPYWTGGKMFLANLLSSFFIRDVNTLIDANNDGRGPGLDPIMPTHIARLNKVAELHAVTHDGVVDGAELQTMFDNIANETNGAKLYLGTVGSPEPIVPKLSILGVTFKSSHNVAKASDALGALGCKDCHSAASNFFTGPVVISPKTNMAWNAGQYANFAKVNGSTQDTDIHPNILNKKGERSLAVNYANTAPDTASSTGFRDVQKAETIYEETFKKRDTSWKTTISGTPGSWWDVNSKSSGTAGRILKIEYASSSTATAAEGTRTFVISNNKLTSAAGLITHMGVFATDFEFTITQTSGVMTIEADSGKYIRLSTQTDVGPLGMTSALWIADPIVRTDDYTGNVAKTMNGRAEYVAYLNSLAASAKAVITTINALPSNGGTSTISVTTGVSVNLVADTTGNGADITYTWRFSDGSADVTGATAAKTFEKLGNVNVTLITANPAGDTATDIQVVKVIPVPANGGGVFTLDVTYSPNATDPASTDLTLAWTGTPPGYDKVKIVWGDGGFTPLDTTSLATTLTHAYKRLKRNLNTSTGEYEYTTKLYFYKANAKVVLEEVPVALTTTSDLVLKARLVKSATSSDTDNINYKMKKGAEAYLVFTLTNKGPGTNSVTMNVPDLPTGLTVVNRKMSTNDNDNDPAGLDLTGGGPGTVDPGTWTVTNLQKGKSAYLVVKVRMAATATGTLSYPIPDDLNDNTFLTSISVPDSKDSVVKDLHITAF